MNKITRFIASFVTVTSLTLVPVAVHAQVVETVPADTTIPTTGGSEVKAPDSGIAPSNKVARNSVVFIGGSLLGAGLGFGVITLRKKKFNQ